MIRASFHPNSSDALERSTAGVFRSEISESAVLSITISSRHVGLFINKRAKLTCRAFGLALQHPRDPKREIFYGIEEKLFIHFQEIKRRE